MNLPTKLTVPQWFAKLLSALLTVIGYAMIPWSWLYRACLQKHYPVTTGPCAERQALDLKVAKYKALAFYTQDPNSGFIMSEHGDSLLFSGLAGCGGITVHLTAARDEDGAWHRQPLALPQEDAASSISRDQLLGVLWYVWRYRRLDIAQDLWDYGVKNHWVMGTGDAARTMLEPGLQGTLALLIEALGGHSYFATTMPQLWNKGCIGYEAHLQVLHILLRGEIMGYIDSSQLSVLTAHNLRQRLNPLFDIACARYTDGNCQRTIRVLLDEHYWPANRLPAGSDRIEPWLVQRDHGPSWLPGEGGVWSGCDLLFVASLL